MKEMKRQKALIDKLNSKVNNDASDALMNHEQGMYS